MIDPTVQGVIYLLLGGLGSYLLWRFYGKRLIIDAILKHGEKMFWNSVKHVVDDPASDEGKAMGRLTGVAMAYGINGFVEMISTKEGREQLKPVMDTMLEMVRQGIYGTWGHILEDLRKGGGAGTALPGGFTIPPVAQGLMNKMFPGLDISQLMQLMPMLQQFTGATNASQGASSLPSGSHPVHHSSFNMEVR